jgi:hypothetical protein
MRWVGSAEDTADEKVDDEARATGEIITAVRIRAPFLCLRLHYLIQTRIQTFV